STPLDSSSSATRSANPSAYLRCQRNGGCTTTVRAPSSSAASTLRRSRTSGSDDHTRWVMSNDGECTDSTGTPVESDSHFSAETSWLMESTQTITSTPSKPSSAASSKPTLARS